MSSIQINPYQKVSYSTITNFTINVLNIVLNTSIDIIVNMYKEDGGFVYADTFTLEGIDYSLWGNDDNYLTAFVCQKYGFTKA